MDQRWLVGRSGRPGVPCAAAGALTPPVGGQPSVAHKCRGHGRELGNKRSTGGTGAPRTARWHPSPQTGKERSLRRRSGNTRPPYASSNSSKQRCLKSRNSEPFPALNRARVSLARGMGHVSRGPWGISMRTPKMTLRGSVTSMSWKPREGSGVFLLRGREEALLPCPQGRLQADDRAAPVPPVGRLFPSPRPCTRNL